MSHPFSIIHQQYLSCNVLPQISSSALLLDGRPTFNNDICDWSKSANQRPSGVGHAFIVRGKQNGILPRDFMEVMRVYICKVKLKYSCYAPDDTTGMTIYEATVLFLPWKWASECPELINTSPNSWESACVYTFTTLSHNQGLTSVSVTPSTLLFQPLSLWSPPFSLDLQIVSGGDSGDEVRSVNKEFWFGRSAPPSLTGSQQTKLG